MDNTVGAKNGIAYLLEIIAYCAVNCYAIISGYVLYTDKEKTYKYSKYATMWFQVLFYSFGIYLLFTGFKYDILEMIKRLLPVAGKKYWYFSAYTGLFFIIPFLNKLIRNLTKTDTTKMIILFFVIYVCYARIGDSFTFNAGYSMVWLVIMYFFGAWLKKCEIPQKIKGIYSLLTFIVSTLVTWVLYLILMPPYKFVLIHYMSPTIVINAISFVILFSKFNFNKFFVGIIKFLSPAAFGVYLIHEHTFIRDNFINGKFVFIANLDVYIFPFAVLGCAFAIFAICLIAERIRISLFKILKINKLVDFIAVKIENFISIQIDKLVCKKIKQK